MESIPKTITDKEKKKFKAIIVDTTEMMKEQARDAGDAKMTMAVPKNPNELKGAKKFFKSEFWKRAGAKIWKHGLWRDYYRNKEVAAVREKILKTGNVFAGEGKDQAAHDKFVNDVMEQFASEYEETIHEEAGEIKRQNEEISNEKEIKKSVKKIIIEYATGKISKEAFQEEEERIFKDLKADTDGKKLRRKEDVMHASNLFEIADQVKKAMDYGEFLENEDFDIDLIYGKSKGGVRTESKFTKAEQLAEKLSHTKLGSLVNETTLSAALSIASSVATKSVQMGSSGVVKFVPIIGSAVVGAGFAKLREAKKIQEERRQHAREMAKGEKFDPSTMERRTKMESSRYETESANSIISSISQNIEILKTNEAVLTPEQLQSMVADFSAVEARIRLSDRRNIDLISYSDSTKVVEERRNLDIERAKMKNQLRKMFDKGLIGAPDSDIDTFRGKDFDSYMESLAISGEKILIEDDNTGISAKDRIFNKMKRDKSNKAAWTALKTGLVIGTTIQELVALGSEGQIGIIEDVYNDIKGNTAGGTENLTALTALKHYLSGDLPLPSGPGNLHEAFVGSNIKIPDGASLVNNPDGSYNLLNGNTLVAEHLTVNPDGTFTPDAQNILNNSGVAIDSHSISGTTQQELTPSEYIQNHPGSTHEMHRSWYDNDTANFDKNELRTHWGENGTGINANGKYVLDISRMTPDGSYHNGLSVDAQELLKKGELKMLVSLSTETQNQVFELPIDPNGQVIVDPNSEIGKIVFANVNGQAKFLGRFAEIGQDMGNNNFRMLSTLEGEGIKGISDTISTSVPETTLLLPLQNHNYNLPPFIPIVPRTPLEKLGEANMMAYYFGGSGFESTEDQKIQYEKERSKTLKENPNATLDQFKEIQDYIKNQDEKYLKYLESMAQDMGPMNPNCRLSICIPVAGHQEGENIYNTLKNFSNQTANKENYELVLFVNRPEKDAKGNAVKPDKTLEEILRFKRENPDMNIRISERILPVRDARIGHIRKVMNDAVLLRQLQRGENSPELIMVSNDADNQGVAPEYIENFISKFDSHKEIDSMVGQLDWDPKSYIRNPLIHIGTRLFQYDGAQSRTKGWHFNSSGANFAFRSSIYAAVGGYSSNMKGGEDTDFGAKISSAREGAIDKKPIAYAGIRTSRIYTSSRRAEMVMKNHGLSPIEQWDKGFSAFDDEVRKVNWENSGKQIDYKNEGEVKKLISALETVINRTIQRTSQWGGSASSPVTQKSLGRLGIKFEVSGTHSIKITDATKLIKGLEQYQKEGLKILERKTTPRKPRVTKENQNKEASTLNNEIIERGIETYMNKFSDNTQKIDAVNKLIGKTLNNEILKKLGVSSSIDEITKELEATKSITNKDEFKDKVKSILGPIGALLGKDKKEFTVFQRKVFIETHNFTPINEIFSYGVDDSGDMHIHLAPAEDFSNGNKIKLIKDALEKIIQILSSHPEIKEISATSPLVTSNPGLLKRIGFKIHGPVSKEQQERDFGSDSRTVSRASITRKEFLEKNSNKNKTTSKNRKGFVNFMKSLMGEKK